MRARTHEKSNPIWVEKTKFCFPTKIFYIVVPLFDHILLLPKKQKKRGIFMGNIRFKFWGRWI